METEPNSLDKGFPLGSPPLRAEKMGAQGWNLLAEDLPLPALVLREAALQTNLSWMRRFLRETGVSLAPHGKTTMAPALFRMQQEAGAWAITVSTAQQVAVCRAHGFQRILLANQLVGRAAIRYVLEALRDDARFEFWCLVDSLDGIAALRAGAEEVRPERPVRVLVEVGLEAGRTGCRSVAAALLIARAVKASAPYLALGGVELYEGIIAGGGEAEDTARVRASLEQQVAVAKRCEEEQLFAEGELLLSAGGSVYFDLAARTLRDAALRQPTRVVLRSGCYLVQDHANYDRAFQAISRRESAVQTSSCESAVQTSSCESAVQTSSHEGGLTPAMEVWAYVQSLPEPQLAILSLGKRDVSYDIDLPIPLYWFSPGRHSAPQPAPAGATIFRLNDQHGYLRAEDLTGLRVGDLIACGISHPCTTFDKWRVLHRVNERYQVISTLRTFF